MYELLKTVLILSAGGFVLTGVLLCFKPLITKILTGVWQCVLWMAVLLFMVLPVYRLIPLHRVQNPIVFPQPTVVEQPIIQSPSDTIAAENTEATPPSTAKEPFRFPQNPLLIPTILPWIWFCGIWVYLLIVWVSYIRYRIQKRKTAVLLVEHPIFDRAKAELGITRQISLKMAPDIHSPMLMGILSPTVYLPCRNISTDSLRMVYLHELTHYKRKDLVIKWLSVVVNAIHWFNPMAYLLCKNLRESCEVACDSQVTKTMSAEEQKHYMKTILDLAEKEEF